MIRRCGIVWPCLLALVAVGPSVAESPEEAFLRGNRAYEAARYEEAVEAYLEVAAGGVRDARVEFNLGNAQFRNGQLGHAILHYERARRLDPLDADIRENRLYARSFAQDVEARTEERAVLRWLQRVQDRIGPDRQAWFLLGVGWLVVGLIAWCSARPDGWRRHHGWLLAGLVAIALVAGASWLVTLDRLAGSPLVVVLEGTVEVLAGPGASHPTLFAVHEGATLEVRAEQRDWLRVSLPTGLNGWIPRTAAERV